MSYKELEDMILEAANDVLRKAAGEIRDELYNEAISAMGNFYSSYSPVSYRRHYYNFMNNSFQKYYRKEHGGKVYTGGIKLTPEEMDSIYQETPTAVFNDVFIGGYHGPSFIASTSRTLPSPYECVIDKRELIENNIQKYIDKAQK